MNETVHEIILYGEVRPDGEKVSYPPLEVLLYTGEVKIGEEGPIPHGRGKCVWKDGGATYEGDWVDGKMQGHGVFDAARLYVIPFALGKPYTYEGQFANGSFHGYGVQRSQKDGWVYEGEFVNGRRQGKGKYTDSYGRVYEGTWQGGFLSGEGTCRSASYRYEGGFALDKYDGYGVSTSKTTRYAGQWRHGLEHGKGVFSCEKYTWDGEWVQGSARGKGVFTAKEGFVFTGVWREDRGEGRIYFPNGDSYEGEVSAPGTYHDMEGLCMHGRGVYRFADGRIYDEGFVYGVFYRDHRETVKAADAVKEAERQKAAAEYRAQKKKERDERRKRLNAEDLARKERLEEECKALFGGETDRNKRYEILKRAFFAAHNTGYGDAMAWELSLGGSPRTKVWQAAIDLREEVEALCAYYELEQEE